MLPVWMRSRALWRRLSGLAAVPLTAAPLFSQTLPVIPGSPCPPPVHQSPCPPPTMPGYPAPLPGGVMPSMPGAMPSMPGAMPSMPGAMPSAPGAMPSAPGAMPSAPGAMPSAPGTGAAPGTATPPGPGAATPPAGGANAPGTATADGGASQSQGAAPTGTSGAADLSAGLPSSTPNMMGNQLNAGRSAQFFVRRGSGNIFVNDTGSTSLTNTSVADNNSPLPRDRVSYRYNLFGDASQVRGINTTMGNPNNPVIGFNGLPIANSQSIPLVTKNYDLHLHTFGVEKTFLDGLLSAEVRIPFAAGLGSKQTFNYGDVQGIGPAIDGNGNLLFDGNGNIADTYNVVTNPLATLGSTATEFGDMTLIFKGLLYQNCKYAVSAGVAVHIPTGPNSDIRVIDYEGDVLANTAEVRRSRRFQVENNTWQLSPFLATLWTPTDRFFVQGFSQIDIPLTKSKVRYSSVATDAVPHPAVTVLTPDPMNVGANQLSFTPYARERSIRGQIQTQSDLGFGYWLLRNCEAKFLTGFAPTVEFHYVTSWQDSDVAEFAPDSFGAGRQVAGSNYTPADFTNPAVGNLRTSYHFLNTTIGATAILGDRATVAAGVALPLLSNENRTFNWEFQLQVNYFFGGGLSRSRQVPLY